MWTSVKCLNDSVKECLGMGNISAYGIEWQLLKENLKKEVLAKMFNYCLIKTGQAICWLGSGPHLAWWLVRHVWESHLQLTSVICQPPNCNDEQSCYQLSKGHMEGWVTNRLQPHHTGSECLNRRTNMPLPSHFHLDWNPAGTVREVGSWVFIRLDFLLDSGIEHINKEFHKSANW